MYEVFEKLLAQKSLTTYKVCKDTGVSQSVISDWKRGRSKPKIDKLIKIADYLGVDVKVFIS